MLNRILLAGARPSSSRVISVASPAREQDRLAHVGVDVGEHRREVGERPDVRVAGVEEHDRRRPEPVGEDQPERRRIDLREVEVRVAESRVELDRDALARGLLDGDDDEVVEQRLRLDAEPCRPAAPPRGRRANAAAASARSTSSTLEPGPVGDDRLQADDAAAAQVRRATPGRRRGSPSKSGRLEDQPLDHRLEPQDLLDPARDDGPQLVEREGRVGAVAGVDQPRLEVGALDDLARQPLDPALAPRGVDRVGRRLAVRAGRPARGSSTGRTACAGRRPGPPPGSTSRSGGSGTRRRRPAVAAAASGSGCRRSGSAARSRGTGTARLST